MEDKPDVMFTPPPDPNTVSHQFTIRVPDCKAAYEVLKARGAEFLTPPYDWARKSAVFLETTMNIFLKSAKYKF